MPINFTPSRGAIFMCDFDMANVPPEMRKMRRAVVVSPSSYNKRVRGREAGRAIVVPFSATEPMRVRAAHVFFDLGTYASFRKPVWAICDCVAHVSHDRLDRVADGAKFILEQMKPDDLTRIEAGLAAALGLPSA